MAEWPVGDGERPRAAGARAGFGHRRPGDRRATRHDDIPRARRSGARGRSRQPDRGGRAMTAPETPRSAVDPVTLEVLRNGLYSVSDEMVAGLIRASYSTNIKD